MNNNIYSINFDEGTIKNSNASYSFSSNQFISNFNTSRASYTNSFIVYYIACK